MTTLHGSETGQNSETAETLKLKAALMARGIDFSACRGKAELQALLPSGIDTSGHPDTHAETQIWLASASATPVETTTVGGIEGGEGGDTANSPRPLRDPWAPRPEGSSIFGFYGTGMRMVRERDSFSTAAQASTSSNQK